MTDPDRDAVPQEERGRWPIGFMLLLGALAIYLGWRLIQGVMALVGWLGG